MADNNDRQPRDYSKDAIDAYLEELAATDEFAKMPQRLFRIRLFWLVCVLPSSDGDCSGLYIYA